MNNTRKCNYIHIVEEYHQVIKNELKRKILMSFFSITLVLVCIIISKNYFDTKNQSNIPHIDKETVTEHNFDEKAADIKRILDDTQINTWTANQSWITIQYYIWQWPFIFFNIIFG